MEHKQVTYSYSAYENDEIKKIRQKYLPEKQQKTVLEQIRKIDNDVEKSASMISITVGFLGMLVFGGGLSLLLLEKGILFGVGMVISLIGMASMISALPLNNKILKIKRKKVAPKILELTDGIIYDK